jgi:hypothetical protein
MTNQKAAIISALLISLAILLAPIALQAFKLEQCIGMRISPESVKSPIKEKNYRLKECSFLINGVDVGNAFYGF